MRPNVCPTLWSSDLMIVWHYDCPKLSRYMKPYDRLTLWSSDLMIVWPYVRLTLCSSELMIWPYVCPVKLENLWSDLMFVRWNLMIVHVDDRLVDDCLLTPPTCNTSSLLSVNPSNAGNLNEAEVACCNSTRTTIVPKKKPRLSRGSQTIVPAQLQTPVKD